MTTEQFTQPRADRDAELVAYDQLSREHAALVADLWELVGEWRAEAERLQEFADKHQGYYLGVVGTRRNCRDHLHAVLDKHAGEHAQGGEGS